MAQFLMTDHVIADIVNGEFISTIWTKKVFSRFAILHSVHGTFPVRVRPIRMLRNSKMALHGLTSTGDYQNEIFISKDLGRILNKRDFVNIENVDFSDVLFEDFEMDITLSRSNFEIPSLDGFLVSVTGTKSLYTSSNESVSINAIRGLNEEQIGVVGRKTKIIRFNEQNANGSNVVPENAVTSLCSVMGSYIQSAASELISWLKSSQYNLTTSYGKGCIICGPSGVGKSMLVESVLAMIQVRVIRIAPSDIFRTYVGTGEAFLESALIEKAMQSTGCVVVLEQLDALAVETSSAEYSIISYLYACIDRVLASNNTVVFLGMATDSDHLPNGITHPKRLGKIIQMVPPVGIHERLEIVTKLCEKHQYGRRIHPDDVSQLAYQVALRGHGYVPAELDALVRDSMLILDAPERPLIEVVVKKAFENTRTATLKDATLSQSSQIGMSASDLLAAIGGLTSVKTYIDSYILLPLRDPTRLDALGLSKMNGVLFHGPSGNGKSMMAQYLAKLVDEEGLANFVSVSCPELVSKVVGESESAIHRIFTQARASTPCILFLDQVDAIARCRGHDSSSEQSMDRMLSTLLVEMDGIQSKTSSGHVIVMATTNRLSNLDPAILRPGRFDIHIQFDPPTTISERKSILQATLRNTQFSNEKARNELLEWVAEHTGRVESAAKLAGLAKEAIMFALRLDLSTPYLEKSHFEGVLGSGV